MLRLQLKYLTDDELRELRENPGNTDVTPDEVDHELHRRHELVLRGVSSWDPGWNYDPQQGVRNVRE